MSLLHALDKTIKFLAPKVLAVMVLIISIQPLMVPGIAAFMPSFEIILIYYWGIHAPKLFPAWFVLLLGLLQDSLYGMPLGITALSNLLLLGTVLSQRKFLLKEPFWVQWSGFVVFSLGASLVKWLLALVILHNTAAHGFMAVQWMLTCALYILMHALCDRLYLSLLRPYA